MIHRAMLVACKAGRSVLYCCNIYACCYTSVTRIAILALDGVPRKIESNTTPQYFCPITKLDMALPYYAQGLLRELYQLQGHSSPGSTEWDWSKYEVPTSSGATDSGARDVVISSGGGDIATPIVTAAELTQGTIPWQESPVDTKTSTGVNVSRRQLSTIHRCDPPVNQDINDTCSNAPANLFCNGRYQ